MEMKDRISLIIETRGISKSEFARAIKVAPASVTQMFIDCENLQAYSTDGLLFYNSYITGSFPAIPTGMQTFAITGDIDSVEITPRWYRR